MFCKQCGKPYVADGATVCVNCGVPKGGGMNFCQNCGAPLQAGAAVCINCGVPTNNIPVGVEQKSKIVAGLLAIFVGALGIHNFYLGNTTKGLIQVLVSIIGGIITCGIATTAIGIWAFVEGILILVGSINTDARGIPLKD